MSNISQMAKLNSGAAFANLAHAYRTIAETLPDGMSRQRLLRMARAAEAKITEDGSWASRG